MEMVTDFGSRTVGGRIDGFRTLSGQALDASAVTLDRTKFPAGGGAFSGETAATGVAGGRWSDGRGEAMGGTFGFAATDGSVSLLGAFTACHCASASDGDPDDPVASRR